MMSNTTKAKAASPAGAAPDPYGAQEPLPEDVLDPWAAAAKHMDAQGNLEVRACV